MSLTFYLRKEHDDVFDKRIAMIRKLGSRLCPVTQAAIAEEVETIAALSAFKPDDWTLGRLYSVVRVCVMLEEAGL